MSQPAHQPDPSDVQVLPRVLGPFDAVTVVVGSIIGSGVFLKASVIARELGTPYGFGPTILVWIVMGLVTLCGSLALAELAAMLPHAGGPYVYLREAYGRLWAFLWGWTEFWIVRTGSLGALACATVIYGDSFLQTLKQQGLLPSFMADVVPLSHWLQCVVSIVLVLICTVVNVIGTKWAARVQNITTIIKVGFLVFLIAGPLLLLKANPSNLAPLWPASISLGFWKAVGLATIAVMWPYDGWINIGPVAEEVRDPQRNVPRALTVGMLIVIAAYVGANLSYHLVLPMDKVAGSSAVAADVSKTLLGSAGAWVAALCVMVSTFGALNSNLLCGFILPWPATASFRQPSGKSTAVSRRPPMRSLPRPAGRSPSFCWLTPGLRRLRKPRALAIRRQPAAPLPRWRRKGSSNRQNLQAPPSTC
jgi:basic amino acid/polyamine antiporter, APA family